MTKQSSLVAAAGLLMMMFAGPSAAWLVDESFDSQSLGADCGTFWKDSANSTVTNIQSSTGGKSCKFAVDKGQTAFGGGFVAPNVMAKGDEVWVRFRLFLPQGFIYGAFGAGDRQKFIRFVTKNGGSTAGHLDWYWNQEGVMPPYQKILEQDNCSSQATCWENFGNASDQPQRGKWETYEMYVKFDTLSVAQGGTGRVRVWKNGVLMGDLTNRRTLNADNHTVPSVMIFSYWNAGSPATQEMYFDDLVATNVVPSGRDSQGNPYIGVGQFVATAAPLPPSGIQ